MHLLLYLTKYLIIFDILEVQKHYKRIILIYLGTLWTNSSAAASNALTTPTNTKSNSPTPTSPNRVDRAIQTTSRTTNHQSMEMRPNWHQRSPWNTMEERTKTRKIRKKKTNCWPPTQPRPWSLSKMRRKRIKKQMGQMRNQGMKASLLMLPIYKRRNHICRDV